MKENPLKDGVIAENSAAIGTVKRQMVRERAAELPVIDGHLSSAAAKPTWKASSTRATKGRLSTAEKASLPTTAFAFPRSRKEPMTDASHVRDAMARFNQVGDVTDVERNLAFGNIQEAARHFAITMKETNWRQFGLQGLEAKNGLEALIGHSKCLEKEVILETRKRKQSSCQCARRDNRGVG